MRLAMIAASEIPGTAANGLQVMKMAQATVQEGHDMLLLLPLPRRPVSPEDLALTYGLEVVPPIEWVAAGAPLATYRFGWRSVSWARSAQGPSAPIFTRDLAAAWCAVVRGSPVIFEAHQMPGGHLGTRLYQWLVRHPRLVRLVTITRALREDMAVRHGEPRDVVVSPDAVDLDRFEAAPDRTTARRRFDLPEGMVAGYVGHLYEGRGIDHLLAVAAGVPDALFLLVGGRDEDVRRWDRRSQEMGLDNVRFEGHVPNRDVPTYLSACDVLLMPYTRSTRTSGGGDTSRWMSPMKMFEYLAAGRTILASDLPVLREVLTPGNAVLLPPRDVAAWTSALRQAADPAWRRPFEEAARATAVRHTWKRRVDTCLGGLRLPG